MNKSHLVVFFLIFVELKEYLIAVWNFIKQYSVNI